MKPSPQLIDVKRAHFDQGSKPGINADYNQITIDIMLFILIIQQNNSCAYGNNNLLLGK